METIYLNTTIKRLYETEVISTRTYNSLVHAGYNTINDIIMSIDSPEDLLKLRNFGKKSFFEMSAVFFKLKVINFLSPSIAEELTSEGTHSQSPIDEIIEFAFQETLKQYHDYSNFISSRFISGNDLHRKIIRDYSIALNIEPSLDMDKNKELRQAFHYFVTTVISKLDECALANNTLYPIYKNIETEIQENLNSFSSYDIARYFLSDDKRSYIGNLYDKMCESDLSVRARSFQLEYLPSFENIIKYFDEPIDKYTSICPGKMMRKTLTEIYALNQKFKIIYKSIENISKEEFDRFKLKLLYPFLNSTQSTFVCNYRASYGHVPLFYIINEYFKTSKDRTDKIFCLRYGLFDNHRQTLEEIAKAYDLSRERIRQITTYKTTIEKNISIYANELFVYSEFFSLPFICENSQEYIDIKNQEKLEFDFTIFSALISILSNNFTIIKILGHTIAINKKSSLAFLDVNRITSTIEAFCNSRFTQKTRVPIHSLAKNIDDDVKINFVRSIVVDYYNLTVENDCIVLQ